MSMGGNPMQALQMLQRRGGGWGGPGGANGYPGSRDPGYNTNPAPDQFSGVHHPGDPYQGQHHPGDPNLGGDQPPMPDGPGDANPGGDAPPMSLPDSGAVQPGVNPLLAQIMASATKGGGYGGPPMKPQPITPPASMQSTVPAVSAIDSPGPSNAPGPAQMGDASNGVPPPAPNPAMNPVNRRPSRPMQRMRQLQSSQY